MDNNKQNHKLTVAKPVKVVKGTKKDEKVMFPCRPMYAAEP